MNYEPAQPPKDPARLAEYLTRELRRIASTLNEEAPRVHYAVGQLTPVTWAANNYKPEGLDAANVVRISASVTQTLSGIALHSPYRLMQIINIGDGVVVLPDEDTGSSASSRFATASPVNLSADSSVLLWYDPISSRWRPLATSGGGNVAVASAVDVQVFSTPGTFDWIKPAGATAVTAVLHAAGGGGAGGSTPGTVAPGKGGQGGGCSTFTWDASLISATVSVVVGLGGAGGAGAVNVDGSNVVGADGTIGGDTSFGAWLMARGGDFATVTVGGAAGTGADPFGRGLTSYGGQGRQTSAAPTQLLYQADYAGAGGGFGGGRTVVSGPGGMGPRYVPSPLAGGTAGTPSSTAPTAGGAGQDGLILGEPGTGGGGGGGHTANNDPNPGGFGAAGGAGGFPAAGGGGGGAGGVAAGGPPWGGGGDGGDGGDGQAIIITVIG